MDRINELEKLIKNHKALYYQGRQSISDSDYDQLEEELKSLDPRNKVLEMVGFVGSVGKKIKHDKKMLSLNKAYEVKDLESWIGEREVISVFKIDGVSGSLIYEKGELVLGKTRGDGLLGEDITHKVRWIDSIPGKIHLLDQRVEIRGELYCDEKSFLSLALEMEKLNLERPSNPRNIVAGLMGRKGNLELCRHLKFKAFEMILEREIFKTEREKLEELKTLNFIVPDFHFHKKGENLEDRLKQMQVTIGERDYQIDGIVFIYNDLETQLQLGATAHHPRYKMAFKFRSESKTTTIESIEWLVSRNGILTPVGLIQPTSLSGAMISRVTLHNFGVVRQYNLKKGDRIEIIRSGEVIPKFVAVIKSSTHKFHYPDSCPVCQSKIKIKDIRLFCPNKKCPGKVKSSILNFIQKIGIEDISKKRLQEMIEKKLVREIPDLYKLTSQEFMTLDKVKDKLANKWVDSIEKSKSVDLITFLSALGIPGGAYNKCEKVVLGGYNTIPKIKKLTVSQLTEIESFAEKSAEEFINGFQEREPLVNELLKNGLCPVDKSEAGEETIAKGKKFCITGTLSRKRSEMEELLRSAGAMVVTSVSQKTDYLLTNESGGQSSKFKKAQSLGIPIISEKEVVKWLQKRERGN